MNHAISVQTFEKATLQNAIQVITMAVRKAESLPRSNFVSRVILLCTAHFAPILQEIAQTCISKTNCMNVWGGCVSGFWGEGRIFSNDAAILIAIFNENFEACTNQTHANHATLKLCMAEHEQTLIEHREVTGSKSNCNPLRADTLGLLSYGANYAKLPRIEHGRIAHSPIACTEIRVRTPFFFNSEGLSFLTSAKTVSKTNGLLLISVDDQKSAIALNSPTEKPRPIGLRLQVINEKNEHWIPVMEVHADGTLELAAPVIKGQKVRLALRTSEAINHEITHWLPSAYTHFGKTPPDIGIFFAGLERSRMCHIVDNDIAAVLEKFPNTEWFGLFGQAAWLNQGGEMITPPRNNRLSLCLFNSPQA